MPKHTASCECGKVHLDIDAEPMVALNCHCKVCQRLSGSGHVFVLAFPDDKVTVKGKVSAYEYRADSGKMAKSHFCVSCGAHVFGVLERFPGTIAISATYLDDSSAYKPQMSVFADRLQPWDRLEPGVPSFPGMPPM